MKLRIEINITEDYLIWAHLYLSKRDCSYKDYKATKKDVIIFLKEQITLFGMDWQSLVGTLCDDATKKEIKISRDWVLKNFGIIDINQFKRIGNKE